MSSDAKRRFLLKLNADAAAATILGLTAALQIAVELAACPDRSQIHDKSPAERLDYVTKLMTSCIKNLYTEALTEIDEYHGLTAALGVVATNTTLIKKTIG